MVVGSKDQRRRKTRCHHCIEKHLKCCGNIPCRNCTSRHVACIASTPTDGRIVIARGSHITLNGESLVHLPILYDKLPDDDQSLYSQLFFADFLPANSFTGRCPDGWIANLKHQFSQDPQLSHTVLALGALHKTRKRAVGRIPNAVIDFDFALNSYQDAIGLLRQSLKTLDPCDAPALLTTTFLLGIFEVVLPTCYLEYLADRSCGQLMFDPSGEGWRTHAMFGASRLLRMFGPDALMGEAARNIFRQVRMFELFRGMLFAQSTTLNDLSWQQYVEKVEYHLADPLELLFRLMASASDLACRTLKVVDSVEDGNPSAEDKAQLSKLAAEGFHMQAALQELQLHQLPSTKLNSQSTLISIYTCALSIYISGIYDYNSIWPRLGLALPSLSRELVSAYVETIITSVDSSLGSNMLSGLLYLIPLRIAGARCWTLHQGQQILQLLRRIGISYAVARSFTSELEELWSRPRAKAVEMLEHQ